MYDLDADGDRPIKHCIEGVNLDTYDYLVAYIPAGWFYGVDDRGQSPLHLALKFLPPMKEK